MPRRLPEDSKRFLQMSLYDKAVSRAHAKVAIKKAQQLPRSPYAEDGFAEARERLDFEDALGAAIEELVGEEAAANRKRFEARKIIARAKKILGKS